MASLRRSLVCPAEDDPYRGGQSQTALSGNDKGVWLLIMRPVARLNDPENSVKEQTGGQALNTEHSEPHATQLMFTPQTFTPSFESLIMADCFFFNV